MGRVIFFLLVVAIVAMWTREASAGGYVCAKKNEVYNNCGTACPPTCENPKPSGACIKVCQKGCECKTGYVRNKDRYCVRPTKCIKGPAITKGLL